MNELRSLNEPHVTHACLEHCLIHRHERVKRTAHGGEDDLAGEVYHPADVEHLLELRPSQVVEYPYELLRLFVDVLKYGIDVHVCAFPRDCWEFQRCGAA